MENSVNERIRDIIDYTKVSDNKFAKMIGVNQKLLSNMFIRGTEPSSKTISSILFTFKEISAEWLLRGKGDMVKPKDLIESQEGLPLLPYSAMAGALSGSELSTMEYECEHYIVPAFHNADFLVRVQGDSMVPRYYSGDIVACKKIKMDKLFFQWGKTYVINTNQGILIKRIDPGNTENCVSIVSYNKEYQTFQLPLEDINQEGIALVVGLLRIE